MFKKKYYIIEDLIFEDKGNLESYVFNIIKKYGIDDSYVMKIMMVAEEKKLSNTELKHMLDNGYILKKEW